MTIQWFDVDKAGLGKQAEEQGKGRLIGELVQNALDEAGVTQIAVTLALVPGRPLADLTVEDDSPEGFRDLSHAYTLFAASYKRGNPEQRGQFNLGEKMVLAVCESASITTTKGTVIFDPDEGRIEKPRQKRERGSVFQGRIKMTREEYPQVCDYLRSLLLPENIVVTFNGDRLLPRKPLHTFEASLETLVADDEGVMRPRVRKTQVGIYEALPGEVPSLYEMGLPVVETGDKWHVNVGQKVPLNRDRDNVQACLPPGRAGRRPECGLRPADHRGRGHRRLVQAGRCRPALLRRGHQASDPAAVRGEGRRPRSERHRRR